MIERSYSPSDDALELSPGGIEVSFELELDEESVHAESSESSCYSQSAETDFDIDISGAVSTDSSYPSTPSPPSSILSHTGERASFISIHSPSFRRTFAIDDRDIDPHSTPRAPGNIGKRISAPNVMEGSADIWRTRRALSAGESGTEQRRRSDGIHIPRADGQGEGRRRSSVSTGSGISVYTQPHTQDREHGRGRGRDRRAYSGPNSPSSPSHPNLPFHLPNHGDREGEGETGRGEEAISALLVVDGTTDNATATVIPVASANVPDSSCNVSGLARVGEHLFIQPDTSPTVPTFTHTTPPLAPTLNRSTPSPVESQLSLNSSLLATPSDSLRSPHKGGPFGSFPTPPPREALAPSTSPRPSLLPSLPINIALLSPDLPNAKEPMSLDAQGHWLATSPHGQYALSPPAFTQQKAPSHPSSIRTDSVGSAEALAHAPPSSTAFSHGGQSRRLSKFTAFSGSSSASSLYSSDTDSIRDRERQYRVTEHPDISTVFEEGSTFEVDYQRETPLQEHRPPQSRSSVNNTSSQRTHRTGTISSNHSSRSNKSVHPFAAVIHRAPSPPSSSTDHKMTTMRPTSPYLSSSRSHSNISEVARMQKPAHQVTLAEEEDADDEEKCPICVESLAFTYRLPGEKPHVVPECGHALHEECFVTVYGSVPEHGSKRNIGLCGVCRQKMRIVEGGGDRKRSKGKKLDMLMGTTSMTPPLRAIPSYPSLNSMQSPVVTIDASGDDPVDVALPTNSSRSFSSESQPKVVVPTISIRSEFSSTTRRQGKPTTAMITIEVPHAGDRGQYPPARMMDMLRSPPMTGNGASPRLPPSSPASLSSADMRRSNSSPPLGNPFATVEAELKQRLVDYKNSGLDSLGPLRLFDMIAVRKGSMLREFLMYLYNDALICISEEKPNAFQKIFSSGSSMRSNDTRSSAGTGSGRGPLKLRGRIYVKHVKKLVDSSVPSELSITILMENEAMESFILTFKDKSSHENWKSTLQQIVDDAKTPGSAGKGGNSANKIAKLMGSGAPPQVPRAGPTATTPGLPSSSSMGFAPTMSDFASPPTSTFSHGRGPSAGDLVNIAPLAPVHTPLDLVIVLSLPTIQNGTSPPLKLRLMRQSLAFVFALMGSKDRVSIVSCELGTSIRRTPLLNPTKYESRRRLEEFVEGIGAGPIPDDEFEVETQQDERHDVVTAMNVALDVILQRKAKNPLTGLILISDTADVTKRAQMDLVCARLDAANIPVHSLGYGKAHDPTPLWMVSNHTQGTYTFVREWYHLRDSLAGVIGGLMTVAMTNMKLHLSAQENEFRIVKVTGTPQAIGSASGKTLDIELKELRFGEKREILVEVELIGDGSPRNSGDSVDGIRPRPASSFRKSPSSLISGMDNMSVADSNSVMRDMVYEEGMVDEVPVIEVDCSFHDPAVGRSVSRLAYPVLLTLAILPSAASSSPSTSDPTVQRRKMELIASDMLTRSLLLVTQRNFVQAHKLLSETRRIVRTISEGIRANLPPSGQARTKKELASVQAVEQLDNIVGDMDALCEALDENPELFGKDQRNFASQQGIVLRSQRSWTMRTGTESYYCTDDVRRIVQISGDWGVKG